jgi:hypothetical protein
MVSAGDASDPMVSAGVRKIPTAMVWPTTNEVAGQRPISPRGAAAAGVMRFRS